jgi:hypothetical protein
VWRPLRRRSVKVKPSMRMRVIRARRHTAIRLHAGGVVRDAEPWGRLRWHVLNGSRNLRLAAMRGRSKDKITGCHECPDKTLQPVTGQTPRPRWGVCPVLNPSQIARR